VAKTQLSNPQWWAQLTEKLASITDNPLTRKLAKANAKALNW